MSGGQYKLTYFNLKARGELIRWILAVGGMKWQDCRVAFKDWPSLKPQVPGGHLPCLTTPEGQQLSQSVAIARYAAAKAGLLPADDFAKYQCDQIVDTVCVDMFNAVGKTNPMQPPEQRAKSVEEWRSDAGPRFLGRLASWVRESRTGYLVGDRLTWADLAVASMVEALANMPDVADQLQSYPELLEFSSRIQQSGKLSDYLKSRPQTEFAM